jgi:hypothetical protein
MELDRAEQPDLIANYTAEFLQVVTDVYFRLKTHYPDGFIGLSAVIWPRQFSLTDAVL